MYPGGREGSYIAKSGRAYKLRVRGMSDTAIANTLSVSRNTVQRCLKVARSTERQPLIPKLKKP